MPLFEVGQMLLLSKVQKLILQQYGVTYRKEIIQSDLWNYKKQRRFDLCVTDLCFEICWVEVRGDYL